MKLDFYLSLFFLLLSLLIIFRTLYLIIRNFGKIFKVSYLTEITVLTALAIAIGSHESINYMFMQKYGLDPINLFF